MTKEETTPKKVKFVYERSKDYNTFYVNGIYGGITPQGELVCNLFHEHQGVPDYELFDLKQGQVGRMIERKPEFGEELCFIREIIVGLTMNLPQAEAIANWILNKVKVAKGTIKTGESDA